MSYVRNRLERATLHKPPRLAAKLSIIFSFLYLFVETNSSKIEPKKLNNFLSLKFYFYNYRGKMPSQN